MPHDNQPHQRPGHTDPAGVGIPQSCRFRLRTLLLLPVLVAFLFAIGPGILEEFQRIESDCVLVEYEDLPDYPGGTEARRFETEITLTAEVPFSVTFSCREVTLTAPNGGSPQIEFVDAEKHLGEFVPDHHILGHNYTLTVQLCAQNGTIRIGSDEKGWCERRFFSDSKAASWRLANMIEFSNLFGVPNTSHCLGINVGVRGIRRFVFTSVGADEGPPKKQRTFDIGMHLWETGDEAARLRELSESIRSQ